MCQNVQMSQKATCMPCRATSSTCNEGLLFAGHCVERTTGRLLKRLRCEVTCLQGLAVEIEPSVCMTSLVCRPWSYEGMRLKAMHAQKGVKMCQVFGPISIAQERRAGVTGKRCCERACQALNTTLPDPNVSDSPPLRGLRPNSGSPYTQLSWLLVISDQIATNTERLSSCNQQ